MQVGLLNNQILILLLCFCNTNRNKMEEKPSTSYHAGTTDASTLGSSVQTRKDASDNFTTQLNENIEANVIHTGKGDIIINPSSATYRVTEQQTAKDCDELKNLLRDEAKRVWKIDQVFCVNHPITIAPLQLAHLKELESLEKLGHFIHRQEILEIIRKPPVGDVLVKNLFIKAKEFAVEFANKYFRKEDSQEKASHIEIHGNIVGVIGQAGIGKTALTKTILKQIINEGLFGVEYAFFLQFRNFDLAKETDLLSFLTKSIAFQWKRDIPRREAVLKALAESDKVILILDGFDEIKQDTSSATNYTVDLYSLAKPEVFIKHILSGKFFPKAAKLITSRPGQLYELSSEFRPRFIVNILGLDKTAQKLICKEICGKNSDEVSNYIQHHADIAAFCYVPVNCILVMHSIHFINEQETELSNSITGIFAVAFGLFLSTPHFRKLFILEKFSKLAWGGFKDNKYYFNESDLHEAGLHEDEQNALLVTALSKNKLTFLNGDPTKFTYYSNLLFQESLVAINLTFYTTPSELEALFVDKRELDSIQTAKQDYDLSESRFEMVAKFLFGFSNKKTLSYLQEKFPFLNVSPDHSKMLHNLALKYMPSHNIAEKEYIDRALPIFGWACEMDDEALTKRLSCQLLKDISFWKKVIPRDDGVIHDMFRERNSPLNIDLDKFLNHSDGDSFIPEGKQTVQRSPAIKSSGMSSNGNKMEFTPPKNWPIVYHKDYNISFLNMEKLLSSFDFGKWGRVHQFLIDGKMITSAPIEIPTPATDKDLLKVHTKEYLESLKWSVNVARITEVAPIALLPKSIMQRKVLHPLRLQTRGSILAGRLAVRHGWSVNIGGGFHHCSADRGEGFCVYADITLLIKDAMEKFPHIQKAMIVDLGARQGNGHKRDFKGNDKVYIMDVYNRNIHPFDHFAKSAIRRKVKLQNWTNDATYLKLVKDNLAAALEEFPPDLLVYNAGTDVLAGDPLGQLDISPEGIIERDEIVFEACKSKAIPIVMLTSGGYQRSNARIIADSLLSLHRKKLIISPKSSEKTQGVSNFA